MSVNYVDPWFKTERHPRFKGSSHRLEPAFDTIPWSRREEGRVTPDSLNHPDRCQPVIARAKAGS